MCLHIFVGHKFVGHKSSHVETILSEQLDNKHRHCTGVAKVTYKIGSHIIQHKVTETPRNFLSFLMKDMLEMINKTYGPYYVAYNPSRAEHTYLYVGY